MVGRRVDCAARPRARAVRARTAIATPYDQRLRASGAGRTPSEVRSRALLARFPGVAMSRSAIVFLALPKHPAGQDAHLLGLDVGGFTESDADPRRPGR